MILNLDAKPNDPIEAIMWLDSVQEAVDAELADAYEEAYFEARLQRRFDAALQVGRASKKRALAFTRSRNEKTGRAVRWADHADPTSTAYRG